MKGTIKTIVDGKNFGFISQEGEVKDLFFHANDVKDGAFADLKVGDSVTFEIETKEKGPAAVGVSRE
ncbi:MAG: cold shock domain-containing protein [bacterium]|nr:cold shock domain-containing protein [bacterium]